MDIRLKVLKLKNFKGIKEFVLDISGKNASVYGDNATGKTTLYDAFTWLLFDKDSSQRKDFSIKTYDSTGEAIHGLEHEVEAILLVDGVFLTLKKVLTEKWTKKRGEAEKEFTGHETAYWVDEVPVKKGEYIAKIASIVDENVFKLITSPLYFNSLNWQDRRKTLLQITGDVSDAEIISSDEKFKKLGEVLSGKTIDDYKKVLNERIKKLNEEIEKIPIRIDELNNSLPDSNIDYSQAEQELEVSSKALQAIEIELTNAAEPAKILKQKQQEYFELQRKLDARKRVIDLEAGSDVKKLVDEKSSLQLKKHQIESDIKTSKSLIEGNAKIITTYKTNIENARADWCKENAKVFVELGVNDCNCPTCGQALPHGAIQEKNQELKAKFEAGKKDTLYNISAQGKYLTEKVKELEASNSNLEIGITESEQLLEKTNLRLSEIDKDLQVEQAAPEYEKDKEYSELKAKIESYKLELEVPVNDKTSELIAKKQDVQAEIDKCNKILFARDRVEQDKKRIEDLKQEERQISAKISELEGHKFLIEQFIRTKVDMLEDSINNRFKTVKFKLFDVQINGGVVECCEALVNTNGSWTPFSDANNAGKINAGLDIIKTLAAHYEVNAPIFVDNRESVNNLIDIESQIINLVVSQDEKLRMEVA